MIDRGIPFLELSREVNLGDPSLAAYYATASYTTSNGRSLHGTPLFYTAAVLRTAPNPTEGAAFVAFLLSDAGRSLLLAQGLLATPALIYGAVEDAPATVRAIHEGR